MKALTPVFLVSLIAVLLAPANAPADGMFVVPRFVWDKHKDINEPTQKAILVYDAGREDLILQVKYEGPVDEFGWLIPVPNVPTVQKGSMKCFYELSQYTQRHFEGGHTHNGDRAIPAGTVGAGVQSEPPVKVIEIKTVGAYEIVVLSTKDSGALTKWLDANRFYFPTNKTDVIDSYVQRQWYFVAVKINLSKSDGFQLFAPRQLENRLSSTYSTALKLGGGELNPLQISFASDRCVFPLKISSVNDKPSELQVYVLSPEPLLEKAMLEKKLPLIYSNDLARAARNAQSFEQVRMMQLNRQRRFMGAAAPADLPPSKETLKAVQRIRATPAEPTLDELLPYAKVTKEDLPDCTVWISRLAQKSWWLTKQTWTFRPVEMRDLNFEPAYSVFSDELGAKYGYYAVETLARFQGDAVPVFLAAFQNTNPVVRVTAASIFNRHYGEIYDPRLTEAAVAWLKDSEPEVRMAAVNVLTEYVNWKPEFVEPVVAMLRDKDPGVRQAVIFALPRFRGDLEKSIPRFQEMLKGPDLEVRAAGLEILQRLDVVIRRADLLPFFKASDPETVSWAFTQLMRQNEKISDDEALVLLRNPQTVARLLGLRALDQNPEKRSVELALPLLGDPDEMVRLKAAQTLRTLTGQQFSEDQTGEWAKWWVQNKTNFVAKMLPEESLALPDGRAYHNRGCDYYDTQDFAEALADFRKSRELGSEVQDYSCYRIWLIRARSGEKEAATQELLSYLKNRKAQNPPDWPLQVGRFLTGQITEVDFLRAAANANSQSNREQHCEAYFYAGAKRLVENDKAGAADFFEKCLGTGVNTFEEYQSAEAELKVLH